MSIWSDALDTIYESDIGTDAVLEAFGTEEVRVLDKTSGIDLRILGKADVKTIVPAACIRRASLVEAGLDPVDLLRTAVTMNDQTWTIINHGYRARPDGETQGELFLILRQA